MPRFLVWAVDTLAPTAACAALNGGWTCSSSRGRAEMVDDLGEDRTRRLLAVLDQPVAPRRS